jgi:hypothetical protein
VWSANLELTGSGLAIIPLGTEPDIEPTETWRIGPARVLD